MGTFNLRYDLEQPQALVGMVADSRVTHTVTEVAAEVINPGQPIGYDGLLLDAAGDVMRGVARLETSLEQTDSGVVQYAIGDTVPLVSFGPVHVSVTAAVTAGAPAFAVISGADKGKFAPTAAASTTTAAVGYFETATAGAGRAVLFVQRGV